MQISTFTLYGLIEGIIFFVIVSLFLLIIIRRARLRIEKLQGNVNKMLKEYRELHEKLLAEREDHRVSNTYKKQINEQIIATRKHHQTLGAKRDITLDLNPESPKDRQTLAIRHAILVAEKEALNASTDGQPNWEFLETKLMQLIQFYVDLTPKNKKSGIDNEAPARAEDTTSDNIDIADKLAILEKMLEEKHQELDDLSFDKLTAEKRVENLEKFKDLFFEMEDQWNAAKKEAQIYYDQLKDMQSGASDQAAFTGLLEQYHNVYHEVERTIHHTLGHESAKKQDNDDEFLLNVDEKINSITNTNFDEISDDQKSVEELRKLRDLTADQHRLISQLQQKLQTAQTVEEKQEIIEDLEKELRKQINYTKESEVCIQLLEDELQKTGSQVKSLALKLQETQGELRNIPKMQEAIRQFTVESKEMIKSLTELENTNETLRAEIRKKGKSDGEPQSQEQVQELQAKLKTLKAKYASLEERYLEQKMAK